MSRLSRAERWKEIALSKTLQVNELKNTNAELTAQVEVYRDTLAQINKSMHFAGRVDYTGFVARIRQELVKVKKWERTKTDAPHGDQ